MNCKWLRQLSCMLALLLAAIVAQAEDLHLKKNISVGGNVVSSSETSIKGPRTRDVTQTPAGATVSLRQCDLKRTVTLNDQTQSYMIANDPQDAAAARAAAMVTGAPVSEAEPGRRQACGPENEDLAPARLVVALTEDRARVDRRGDVLGELRVEPAPALLRDAEVLPEERLRRRCAEAHDHLWTHCRDFGIEPRSASRDLNRVRFFVNAPLPSRLPLEVFHHIRDIDVASGNAGRRKRFVQYSARRTDEWMA